MFSSKNWSVERAVVVLTPLVFAPLAAAIAAYVASHFPGLPHPRAGQIEGVEISSFVIVGGVVIKWLHGRQIPEIAQLPPMGAQQREALKTEILRIVTEREREFVANEFKRLLSAAATPPPPNQ